MAGNPNNNNYNSASFDREAFKHAIGMIESRGGKYLSNPTSSAAGKYHFLYNLIKKDPDMKGVSYRKFIGDPDLQERIMEKALDGKLAGYAYGENYAKKLINEAGSNRPVSEVAALVHFLGSGGARKFLKNPDTFQVPGTNLTGDQYLSKFKNYYNTFQNEKKPGIPDDSFASTPQVIPSEREEAIVQKDGTAVRKTSMKDIPNRAGIGIINLKDQHQKDKSSNGLQFLTSLTNELNQLRYGGYTKKGNWKKNNYKYGGKIKGISGVNELVTLFEAGGTHENNPIGGIPQGIGANGKPNLVEEGETKWNGYIFSNSISLDGTYELGDESGNVFENGGELDPTDPKKETEPIYGPVSENSEGDKYPMKFTKTRSKFYTKGRDQYVEDERSQYLQPSRVPFTTETDKVNFNSLVQDEQGRAFLERYNNPWAREKMKEQTGLSDYDIDNMIIKGLKAKKQVGGNVTGSKASYDHNGHIIHIGEEHADDANVETHERVHASAFDAAQGLNLVDVLGNSFQQGETRTFLKNMAPDVLRYLNMPHEAYGNFVEFREKIGLKPGEQITVDELKRRVKKAGATMENFYRAFNDENIVKALNTIAYQENNNNDDYKLA